MPTFMQMENKKLLIVGIDPGTTTGCAVLDIEGNLVYLQSSKQLDLKKLISETIIYGKAVLVGTDKVKVPSLVKSFAIKLGAKIVSPSEDLKVYEKRNMISDFKVEDDHQGDALASALFAYKNTKPLLDKIDFFADENKKHDIKNIIKGIVIMKKISIKNAVRMIEKKDEEPGIIENTAIQTSHNDNHLLKLHNKMKAFEVEIGLLRNYNSSLKNKIANLEKNEPKKSDDKNKKILIDFRENRIKFLESYAKSKDREIEGLKNIIRKLNNLLSNINNLYVLKRLDNLGISEFNSKNKFINIQKNDILLVDNPNIVSDALIDLLKDKVSVIVHKKPVSNKIEGILPFVFINADNIKIEEYNYFGLVEKRQLDIAKDKVNWAKKIIEDYKKEKQQLISR